MERIWSFPPVIRGDARILILGSMPGKASLEAGEYYAHPMNQFWMIIRRLAAQEEWRDYQHKQFSLLNAGIALWDVVRSCTRIGSSDSRIQDAAVHDIPSLLSMHPSIQEIYFNGAKAQELFQRRFKLHRGIRLPSTSPACTMPLEEKIRAWSAILQYVS